MLVIFTVMLRFLSAPIFFLFCISLQAAPCIQENRSDEQNFTTCQQRVNSGDIEAIDAVASMYEKGTGTEKDVMQAFRHYERSANLGNVLGQFHVGRLYEQGVNGARNAYEAVNWLKKAADQQYTPAMEYLARIYFYGKGVNKSYEKAYQWITRSGGANSAEKHYFIGFMSLNGHVIKQNLEKAYDHLLTAASAGQADAQFELGEMYRLGTHVEINDEIALSWLEKALRQDHPEAELAIKKIDRKREHEAYAQQQKMTASKSPYVEIKVIGPANSETPEKATRQNDSGGWGLHILLFFILLIVVAILLLRNRSTSNQRMTEHEKEVINQALKAQLEKQPTTTPRAEPAELPEKKDDFYDNSLLDIAKQELEMNTLDKVLWDEVSSEAHGDMARAELLYLKKRVKALMDTNT